MNFMMTMSQSNEAMTLILWMFVMLVIPGYTIMNVAKWLGFPPLVMMEKIFLGEDDEQN